MPARQQRRRSLLRPERPRSARCGLDGEEVSAHHRRRLRRSGHVDQRSDGWSAGARMRACSSALARRRSDRRLRVGAFLLRSRPFFHRDRRSQARRRLDMCVRVTAIFRGAGGVRCWCFAFLRSIAFSVRPLSCRRRTMDRATAIESIARATTQPILPYKPARIARLARGTRVTRAGTARAKEAGKHCFRPAP